VEPAELGCPKVFVGAAAVCPTPVVEVEPKAGLFAPNPPNVLELACCVCGWVLEPKGLGLPKRPPPVG